MNNENKLESTQKHLEAFTSGLKEVAEELSESEFDDYLKVNILPELIEDKTVYGDSIWGKMDVLKTVYLDSVLEERGLNMETAITKMDVDSIMWMMEHLSALEGLIFEASAVKFMKDSRELETLKEHHTKLQKWIDNDMFERIQDYQHEIKELREVKA